VDPDRTNADNSGRGASAVGASPFIGLLSSGQLFDGGGGQLFISAEATKVSPFQKPEEGKTPAIAALSRDYVMTQVEASLRRLGTDYIDLYLYHNPDQRTPAEELARTMDALVRAGKIRYCGASNFSPKQIGEFLDTGSSRRNSAPLAGLEDYYNIIAGTRRDLMEDELFPLIRRGRLGLMAFSPIAEGRLAPGREVDRSKPWAPVVDVLDKVARELSVTRPQVCVAWVLARQEVTSVLAGAELPEHVDDNFAGTRLVLPAAALAALNAASDKLRSVDTSGR